ncbi:MAG: inorganic phosphate transporter [Opitutaceae bacterium]|nr:inorganic phosphate transporter [Cytophagales bacterium]
MFGLEMGLALLLILCIVAACAFEFVNGFHHTANAVATVIYTNALKPEVAVAWSGLWNFLGVLSGAFFGLSVASGIVNLLPLEALVNLSLAHSMAMIFSLLLTAILWNLGTWYFGIPCSSSHTLVGAILGVGLAFSYMPQNISGSTINWAKAADVGLSLLISPVFGFGLTIILMFTLRSFFKNKPELFKEPNKDKKPPAWIRAILILTCTGVSFSHGSNDGQKGVGLIMLILIAIIPSQFALNNKLNVADYIPSAKKSYEIVQKIDDSQLTDKEKEIVGKLRKSTTSLIKDITDEAKTNSPEGKLLIRKNIMLMDKQVDKLANSGNIQISSNNLKELRFETGTLKNLIEYAPFWVIVMISISLGLGTMVGWKRIVVTLGEKIGKQHLTYAQGASSELVAASTIGVSTYLGLPVSTTQVLSSAIAGSMVASKGLKNLQGGTVRNIFLAWVLTLPVCITLSALLFFLFSKIL